MADWWNHSEVESNSQVFVTVVTKQGDEYAIAVPEAGVDEAVKRMGREGAICERHAAYTYKPERIFIPSGNISHIVC